MPRRRGREEVSVQEQALTLDATLIDLCAEMFEWAAFRRTKGAVKLHFTLDHDGYLPTALVITEGSGTRSRWHADRPLCPARF